MTEQRIKELRHLCYIPPAYELQRGTVELLDEVERLTAELAAEKREKDAAVRDLRDNADRPCLVCKKWIRGRCSVPERDCAGFWKWEWRGPVAAEGDA